MEDRGLLSVAGAAGATQTGNPAAPRASLVQAGASQGNALQSPESHSQLDSPCHRGKDASPELPSGISVHSWLKSSYHPSVPPPCTTFADPSWSVADSTSLGGPWKSEHHREPLRKRDV